MPAGSAALYPQLLFWLGTFRSSFLHLLEHSGLLIIISSLLGNFYSSLCRLLFVTPMRVSATPMHRPALFRMAVVTIGHTIAIPEPLLSWATSTSTHLLKCRRFTVKSRGSEVQVVGALESQARVWDPERGKHVVAGHPALHSLLRASIIEEVPFHLCCFRAGAGFGVPCDCFWCYLVCGATSLLFRLSCPSCAFFFPL
jgi:hypothetical protein